MNKRKNENEDLKKKGKKQKKSKLALFKETNHFELFERFLTKTQANKYLEIFSKLPWQKDSIIMRGNQTKIPRLIFVYGDEGSFYRHSGTKKMPNQWDTAIIELKKQVEEKTGESYNFAYCNLYRTGEDYIGMHSDATEDLAIGSSIVSITLGAERDFVIEEKKGMKNKYVFALSHGSMLIMKDGSQTNFKHGVPKRKRIKEKRINITFRKIKN